MAEIWFPNLGIEIEHLSRIAFTFLGNDIYWYGITMSLAVLIGTIVCIRECKNDSLDSDLFVDFMIVAFFIAFICARLYYVVFSWDNYKDDLLSIFALRQGGIAIYGGVIGGILTSIWYARKKNLNLYGFMDIASLGLITGQIIGRIGNFINREAFGGYADNLFSMRLRTDSVSSNYITQELLDNLITIENVDYIQVHPTFLYEMIWNFCVLLLLKFFKKKKKFHGQIVLMYFTFYGIGRFWIEGLRTDQLKLFSSDIAVSQLLSAALVLFSIIVISISSKKDLELVPIQSIPEELADDTDDNSDSDTNNNSENSSNNSSENKEI